jgi:cold shock CspA family protein
MGVVQTGTLRWFNRGKGYGFLIPDDGGTDVMLHLKSFFGYPRTIPQHDPAGGTRIQYLLETERPEDKRRAATWSYL